MVNLEATVAGLYSRRRSGFVYYHELCSSCRSNVPQHGSVMKALSKPCSVPAAYEHLIRPHSSAL